jgi:hypothetical protein
MSWLAKSDAFDRSRNIPILIYLSSSDLYTLSIKSAIAVLVDLPFKKPCCLLLIMPWLFRNDTSYWYCSLLLHFMFLFICGSPNSWALTIYLMSLWRSFPAIFVSCSSFLCMATFIDCYSHLDHSLHFSLLFFFIFKPLYFANLKHLNFFHLNFVFILHCFPRLIKSITLKIFFRIVSL